MKMKENAMKNTIDYKQKGQLRIRGVASISLTQCANLISDAKFKLPDKKSSNWQNLINFQLKIQY